VESSNEGKIYGSAEEKAIDAGNATNATLATK